MVFIKILSSTTVLNFNNHMNTNNTKNIRMISEASCDTEN